MLKPTLLYQMHYLVATAQCMGQTEIGTIRE